MQKDKLELVPRIDSPELWERALGQLGKGGSLDRRDGLKYALTDRWIHLRRSNTEPALRIIAEAPDAESARAMIEQVRTALLA
jgi:phosphomannomutase